MPVLLYFIATRNENSAEDNAELTADLATATASLDATNTMLATLPEGETKETQLTKKMELELKIRKLTKSGNGRRRSHGRTRVRRRPD